MIRLAKPSLRTFVPSFILRPFSSSHCLPRPRAPFMQVQAPYRPPLRPLSTVATPPAVPFRTHIGPLPSSTSQSLTPNAHVFWHSPTSTWTYVVVCPTTKKCVIIDPALDYDPTSQKITTESADALLAFIAEQGYEVEKILESHAHADHLTSARYLKMKLGGNVENGIGEKITQTQEYFAKKYEIDMVDLEGSFDKLWKDGEKFEMGECECNVIALPGHTVRFPSLSLSSILGRS